MIGKTLGIYIAVRFLKILAAMVLGLAFLIVTVDFIEQLRRAAEVESASTWQLYQISLLRTPIFVERIFPFACLFAAMITLNQLNSKMELVVARASGVSAWQFLLPITASTAVVGILVATTYNPLAVRAFHASNELSAIVLPGRALFGRSSGKNHWIKQENADGGLTFINSKQARREGKFLDQVKVVKFDAGGNIISRINARHAVHQQDQWLLIDVSRTGADGRTTKMDKFSIETQLTDDELLGSGSSPEEVAFWNLREVAERVEKSGTNGKPYLVHYHSLTALPLFLVAMTIVAATVSLKFVRFGQLGKMIFGGIFFGFVLYTMTSLITALGSNGIVPPIVAAWAPGFVATLFGMSMLLHQEDG